MKVPRRFSSLLAATAVVLAVVARAADAIDQSIAFTDPAKPGTLKIQLARGDLRIEGTDTAEVHITSNARAVTSKPRKDGLRVLTSASSFSLTEKENVITLDALGDGWTGSGADFKITVPRSTTIIVQNSFGGDITCSAVSGDLDITSMNGEIRLDGVSGGVVVQTMNGEISANVTALHENKPLSFTSMNGEVVIRVPASAKANLRFRTQNGSVLTDFPESALVTKTEGSSKGSPPGGGLPPEARQAIREAGRVAAEVAREVQAVMREAAEVAREGASAAREGAESGRATDARPPKPPKPATAPRVPKPPMIPPVSGGKLLTGTLNGGGPEISVATMNGDVTLRQIDLK